jgi:hypothetical protein
MNHFNTATQIRREQEVPLDVAVQRAVCEFLGIPDEDVITVPNKEKYYRDDASEDACNELREVFDLMRQLNIQGVNGAKLCRSELGGTSFIETLRDTVDDLIAQLAGRRLRYVELGPEPIKTMEIVSQLLEAGIVIDSYTAVDINPASSAIMREALGALLPADKIDFVTADYHNLNSLSFGATDSPVLVTMLGFQEGNEAPYRMAQFFRRVMSPGDVLLAEMQLLPAADWRAIFDFYSNDLMRRFSKIGFRRVFGDLDSEYGVVLVPVPMEICGTGFVAVTTERILANGELKNKIFIINYCIKYTVGDFRRIREFDGTFRITAQRITGNGSVGFQVAERR